VVWLSQDIGLFFRKIREFEGIKHESREI